MRAPLESWLNSLSAADRRVFVRLAADTEVSPELGGLLRAVAAEIRGDEFAEAATLQQLDRDRLAELDSVAAAIDWPARNDPPRTKSLFFDPETGETRIEG